MSVLYHCWQDEQGRHRHNISVGMKFQRELAPGESIPTEAVSTYRNSPNFKCCKDQEA